ncbi:MFS transporter [Streptomyces sp. NPDC057271]|uniref:MFS transporter n=1 Tax=unclassified Streptomyces TaxID=2593676 RepID=UPI00363A3220
MTTRLAFDRKYALLQFLEWLPGGLMFPSLVVLLAARDMSAAQIGLLLALAGMSSAVFEIPAGALADMVGRKPVVLAASCAKAVGLLVLALASAYAVLAAALLLLGFARAAHSGATEAWYVNSLPRFNGDAGPAPGLARGQACRRAAIGIGALTGGLVPLGVDSRLGGLGGGAVIPLSLPLLLGAMTAFTHGCVVYVLMGEQGGRQQTKEPHTSLRNLAVDGRDLLKDRAVTALLVTFAGVGAAAGVLEVMWPMQAARALPSAEASAAAFCFTLVAAFLLSALCARSAPWLAGRIGERMLMRTAILLAVTSVAAMAFGTHPVAMAIAYIGFQVAVAVQQPTVAACFHGLVRSRSRGTALSIASLAAAMGGALGSSLAAWGNPSRTTPLWLVSATMLLLSQLPRLRAASFSAPTPRRDLSDEPV